MIWALMRSLINLVPVNIIDVFRQESEYDFFQPLEIIGGQSLSDFYVLYAQHTGEICKSSWEENTYVQGIL